MLGLQITQVKQFMNKLLVMDCFDDFLVEEASITTYNTFQIDGHVNKDFFSGMDELEGEQPEYEFSKWSDLRSIVLQLIKGKRTPLQMRFVFHLKPDIVEKILETTDTNITMNDLRGLVLSIRFDTHGLKVITAISYQSFVLDKSMDKIWDQWVKQMLTNKQIEFEEV